MTLAHVLRYWRLAYSTWKSAGGGRHVPEMRSPRIAQAHWLALMVKDESVRCEN